MTKVRLYVEGGGDNAGQKRVLRIAIGRLLERGLVDRRVYGKPKLDKINHACQLLPRLNVAKVSAKAKHFKRLLDFLASHLK